MRRRWTLLLVVAVALAGAAPRCQWGALDLGVRFDDAEGFTAGDPVLYKGVQIGQVTGVTLEAGKAIVLAEIESEHRDKVKRGAQFLLRTPGLLDDGPRALVLDSPGTGEALEDGARLEGTTRGGALLNRASKALGRAAKQLRKAVDELPSANSPEVQKWLDQARGAAEELRRAGEDEAARFQKETLPKLRSEMEALKRELEESGKVEQAKKVGEEFRKLFE